MYRYSPNPHGNNAKNNNSFQLMVVLCLFFFLFANGLTHILSLSFLSLSSLVSCLDAQKAKRAQRAQRRENCSHLLTLLVSLFFCSLHNQCPTKLRFCNALCPPLPSPLLSQRPLCICIYALSLLFRPMGLHSTKQDMDMDMGMGMRHEA